MGNIQVAYFKGHEIISVKNGVKIKGINKVFKTLVAATDSIK